MMMKAIVSLRSKTNVFLSRYLFLLLAVVLSLSYFSFGTYRNWPYKIESDGKYYYQYLLSGVIDKDFDFSNNYRVVSPDWMVMEIDHYGFRKAVNSITRKPKNVFTVGPAIMWLPFYIAVDGVGRLLQTVANLPVDLNPWGKYFQYAVMYSGVVYCLLGLYLLFVLLKDCFHESTARMTVWLILFASPLYYYTVFEVSMSHVYDFFTFTLVLFLFSRLRENSHLSYYILLGFSGALHVLVRTQNIVNIMVLSLVLLSQGENAKSLLKPAYLLRLLLYMTSLAIGLMPLLMINFYLFGHPLTIPQGSAFLDLRNPHVLLFLFSNKNGLFAHHPILLIGFIGYALFLVKCLRSASSSAIWFLLLVIAMLQVYINSSVADWWSGHSFGQRRMVFCLPLFAFGIGYVLEYARTILGQRGRGMCVVLVLLGSLMGFCLTLIHVFFWDYEASNNIYAWIFYYAPLRLYYLLKLYELRQLFM